MKRISYKLYRSERKTIAIYITSEATVEVRAPFEISESEIDKFVLKKHDWIEKKLSARNDINTQKRSFNLHYGDAVIYRGREYPIQKREGNIAGFDGSCFYIPENLESEQIKNAVIQIYKLLAKSLFTQKAAEFSRQMSLLPIAVKVNSAKTRWGSCSGKNSINFSWRLVMASDDVIDYVVVHELAHIKEHNHSDRFWALILQTLPDYRQREEKLKILQKRLSYENWD